MYVGNDFSPASPNEARRYTFDFSYDLGDSETISSAVWNCEVPPELNTLTDPNPASHIMGSASSLGDQTVQEVGGLLAGIVYRLRAVVTTSLGATIELYSHVKCIAPI